MERIVVEIENELRDLIPAFLQNRRRDVDSLRQALTERDLGEVARLAHSLKGVGGGFGFDRVTEVGRDIEAAIHAGDADLASRLTEELGRYLERLEVVFVR